jgi:CHAD domain-containing protein
MMPPPEGFLLPHNVDALKLAALLGDGRRCVIDESHAFSLGFFDSFDWRLHQDGLRLLRLKTPQGGLLRLKPARGGEPVATATMDDTPSWPRDLPSGDLRDRVSELLEMRVLLSLVDIDAAATELRLLNADEKTTVRIQYLQMRCRSADASEPRALWPRIRLVPVRGYEEELIRLAERMADELEWPAAPACLFDEAITAVGREAGDYSSKLDVALRPDEHAVDATRRVLRALVDTLERNIPGTRADLDSEFLHDLRVATRRTRSALSQVKRVLPDAVVEDFKARFAWLGQITGPVRDLDVFLLELPHYRASLPASMAPDLDPLEARLKSEHTTEQAKLKRKLASAEMRQLLADWHAVLDADQPPGEPGWFADLPIERVASRRIWRMYKKVRKDGRAVTPDGPADAMHELRKDCKKLRYLIEFFRGLYPKDDVKDLIKALKALLDNLGAFQDLEVQADKLRGFARGFDLQDPDTLPTVMAIGALVADLLARQQAAHARFADCFAAFDKADNRKRYERLFKEKAYKSA